MATTLAEMKKMRQAHSERLKQEMQKVTSPASAKDDSNLFWQPTTDKSGNGMAIIRFLPEAKGEDTAFIRLYTHGFKGPTGVWYIENSLTTIGKQDPIAEFNGKLWNSGLESDKLQARAQKRRLTFISNIYVVKDPGNPENEGKVFLFRYGKKIFDKLNDMMNPPFEDETPVNPFDFWEGANFRMKIRTVDGYRNYDKSEFDSPSPLFDDEDKIDEVWNAQQPLKQFIDPSKFKTYEELQERLNATLGLNNTVTRTDTSSLREVAERDPGPMKSSSVDDDDDSMDEIFKKLNME